MGRLARPMIAGRFCAECGESFDSNAPNAKRCRKPECAKAADDRSNDAQRAKVRAAKASLPPPAPQVFEPGVAGIWWSGYREEAPRESTAPPLLSCPHCRGWTTHSGWCPKATQ